MRRIRGLLSAAVLLAVASLGGTRSAPATEEFHAYLLPESSAVEIDSILTIAFAVDSTAHHFNGYGVTIQFDPAILAFEAVEEGTLMTGACSPNFTVSSSTESTVTFDHILLCAGVFVDGPGELSVYRFRGLHAGRGPLEIVSDIDCTFYDAGICVRPSHPELPRQVIFHDAIVDVGSSMSPVPRGAPSAVPGLGLRYAPNPAGEGGCFQWAVGAPEPLTLEVVDARGRRVFTRRWAVVGSGGRQFRWDGVGDSGARLPGGVYFARLTRGAASATTKIVLVR
jgi:hypothetical protein